MGGTILLGGGLGPIGPGDSFLRIPSVGDAGRLILGGAGGGISGTGATILEYSRGDGPESVFS
jgi:hypothetical protein